MCPLTSSGVLSAMSAMVNLEVPWINIMSKMDLVSSKVDDSTSSGRIAIRKRRDVARFVALPKIIYVKCRDFDLCTDTWIQIHIFFPPLWGSQRT